ncbi:MAG: hypothetical protein Q9201_006712 [Fulgogasparrea decipioides]
MSYRHYICGCSYTVNYTKQYLPQVQLDAHTIILANTSRTNLRQTFSNPSSDSIKQCIYTFPMYDGVSVVAFACRIGSRVVRGVVKERSQAKATFDAAVSRGETAGLLEQLPNASDVFSTRLGNIPANEKVHVEITYVGELKHDAEADGIRFTLPTRIAPRYGSQPQSTYSGGSRAREEGGISITIDICIAQGSFIRGVQSPSHPIAVTMANTSTSDASDPAMHQASATLSLGSTELDQDFVLIVLTKDTGVPKAILEAHETIPNQKAMLLTLVPKFSLPPSHPEIVFVADRSGSMQREIPTLISALKVFIKSLPFGVKFNICSFGSTYSFLWPKSEAYSRDSMNEALVHVDSFAADFGGTETCGALKSTIDNRYRDIPCEVMLLTDGDIWDQNSLFTYLNDEVRKSESGLRVFALGIGDGVSHALIEGVARAGNGFAQVVHNSEKLDSKVIRMLKGGLTPHTTDYSLEVSYEDAHEDFEMIEKVTDALKVILSEEKASSKSEGKQENKPISFFNPSSGQAGAEKPPSADNDSKDPFAHLPAVSVPTILQTPQAIPSLFPFSRTCVYLLFSGESAKRTPKSVNLRAKSQHGPLELEIPVETVNTLGKTVHQLAARKAIQELEEGRGWIYEAKDDAGQLVKDRYPSRFDEIVQREAVRIGVQFQVGGKFCSFVAVKDNDKAIESSVSIDDTGVLTPASGFSESGQCDEAEESDKDMGFGLFNDSPALPMHSQMHTCSSDGGLMVGKGMSQPAVAKRSRTRSKRSGFSLAKSSGWGTRSAGTASFTGVPFGQPAPAPAPGQQSQYGCMANTSLSSDRRFSDRSSAVFSHDLSASASGPQELKRDQLRELAAVNSTPREPVAAKRVRLTGGGGPGPPPWRKEDTRTDNEKVHAVIGFQDFEGWWRWDQNLLEILRVAEVDMMKEKEWVTVLVIKWLETKMASEKEVWELVVEKARAWLAGRMMGTELERLAGEVLTYLQ